MAAAASLLVVAPLSIVAVPNADGVTQVAACHDVDVPVTVDGVGQATIHGELCLPAGPVPGTVQLLVHGGTYTHEYWNWQQQPATYSYVRHALDAGHATFAVDRLGAGNSTRPLSAAFASYDTGAQALHQVIDALRGGDVGSAPAFSGVVMVGHSMGSAQAWVLAEKYPDDVDAYVITGLAHRFDSLEATDWFTAVYPATLDSKFVGKVVDPLYLTTIPGKRTIFYDTATADPAVIARDEQLKDTISTADILNVLLLAGSPPPETSPSRAINVPTLIVLGESDVNLMTTCAEPDPGDCEQEIATDEAHYYGPEADLDVAIVPGGHDINLHPSAPDAFGHILNWIGDL